MSLFQNHSDLFCLSFRRKPESSKFKVFWTPVFTGVTVMGPPERVYIVSTLMKRYTSCPGGRDLENGSQIDQPR